VDEVLRSDSRLGTCVAIVQCAIMNGGFEVTRYPTGNTHIYTITGRAVMVKPDGTIEVTEEEANPLLAVGSVRT
jgi:hypothetical protein